MFALKKLYPEKYIIKIGYTKLYLKYFIPI